MRARARASWEGGSESERAGEKERGKKDRKVWREREREIRIERKSKRASARARAA